MTTGRKRGPNPPDYLSADSQRLWRVVLRDYELGPHDCERLAVALQARDRMTAAREVLDAEGTCYLDRFGTPRARPEIGIERDSRLAYLRALREVGLDALTEEQTATPRPPRLRYNE